MPQKWVLQRHRSVRGFSSFIMEVRGTSMIIHIAVVKDVIAMIPLYQWGGSQIARSAQLLELACISGFGQQNRQLNGVSRERFCPSKLLPSWWFVLTAAWDVEPSCGLVPFIHARTCARIVLRTYFALFWKLSTARCQMLPVLFSCIWVQARWSWRRKTCSVFILKHLETGGTSRVSSLRCSAWNLQCLRCIILSPTSAGPCYFGLQSIKLDSWI
jgi:hypothetical protein